MAASIKNKLKIRTIATVVSVFIFWIIIFIHTFMGVFAPMFGSLGKPIFETFSGSTIEMSAPIDMTNSSGMSAILSENVRPLDIIMFAATILLGIFLIRSVAREARQRSELETMAEDLKNLNANLDQKVKEQTEEIVANLKALQKSYEEEKKLRQEHEDTIKLLTTSEAELKVANGRLEVLMAAKTEFISVAAHELRTPLTAIKWIVQLLHKDAASFKPEQAEQVGKLTEIVNKMVTLVGDILNVSRIEEGRFGSTLKKQAILPVLESVLSTVAVNAEAKKIKLVKNIPASLPTVDLDEENLKLSLENIISNAVKYTPAGGQVTVTAATAADKLTIVITDTGIGIAPADQTRLFDKFFRANNALKYDTEGTGLGLFIARNIIDAHHGKIAFVSELNKGTTFTITMPTAK